MTTRSKLDALTKVSGNAKLDLLKSFSDDKELQAAFEAAYNPFYNFWVTTFPEVVAKKQNPSVTLMDAIAFIKTIKSRSNVVLDELVAMASKMTTSDEDVLRMILARDLRCGVNASSINKVWKNLIPEFPVMLCRVADEKNKKFIKFPAYVQTKMDGMRVNVVVQEAFVDVFSRNGKPLLTHGVFNHLSSLANIMGPFVIDGELLFNFGETHDRQTGNGLGNKAVRHTITAEEAQGMYVTAWDYIPLAHFQDGEYETPYSTRLGILKSTFSNIRRVNLVESFVLNDWEGVTSLFEEMLAMGQEGVIVKNFSSPWENKRSKHMQKLKAEKEVELRIVGFKEGTGQFEGSLGALECATDDGLLFVSVSGMTPAMRDDFWQNRDYYLTKVVTVRFNAIIRSKSKTQASLFLPRLVTVREDKDVTNTLKEIEAL
jgi:ATP-dependent DNA ligase